MPGGETAGMPVEHLALSKVLLFLFDPTQHPKFRKECQGKTSDPQMGDQSWTHQQDQVLLEAAKRIRIHSGWPQNEKYPRPLVVVVTKYDAWCSLFGDERLSLDQVVRDVGANVSGLDLQYLRSISDRLRNLLLQHAHEIVSAAESFFEDVIYIPVSALGHAPEVNDSAPPLPDGRKPLGIRPQDIDPMWVEVPLLYAIHRSAKSLIRKAIKKSDFKERRK